MKKRQTAEIRKPEILKSFYDVIIEEGFENTSIQKIAKKINVNPSLIIHYFSNKENMVTALVDQVLDSYNSLFSELTSHESAPETRLVEILEAIWSEAWHSRINISVVYAILSMSFRNSGIFDRVVRVYEIYQNFLEKEFRRFSDAGIIRGIEPETATDIIISMSEGSHYFMPFHIKNEDAEAHRARMIDAAITVLDCRESLGRLKK